MTHHIDKEMLKKLAESNKPMKPTQEEMEWVLDNKMQEYEKAQGAVMSEIKKYSPVTTDQKSDAFMAPDEGGKYMLVSDHEAYKQRLREWAEKKRKAVINGYDSDPLALEVLDMLFDFLNSKEV